MQLLEKYAMLQAAKRGVSPSMFQQQGQAAALENMMSGYKNAAFQSDLLQAPEVRSNPQVWSALGLTGNPTQGAAGSLTGGPAKMQQFVTNVAQGRPVSGQPADLPRAVETDSSITRMLKGAQARQLNSLSGIYETLGLGGKQAGAGAGGMGDFQVEKISPSGPTIGRPKAQVFEAGTLGPDGKPLQPGLDTTTGTQVRIKQPAGQTSANAAVKGQVSRLNSSLAAFEGLDEPVTFPDGRKTTIWDAMGQVTTPGIGQGGMLGTMGELLQRAPGAGTVGESRLASWANDKALNPDERKARQQVVAKITTVQGLVANAVKALGDAGNLAEGEQKLLRDAFLPVAGENPGLSREKVQRAKEIMTAMREGLLKGITRADARALIGQAAGVQLTGDPAKAATDAERLTDLDAEGGVAVGGGAAPPAGRSAYNPADLDAAETLFR